MTDDLRLRVANRLDAMILAELAAGKSASDALYVIADAILPLLDNPLIDEDDWNRWHQAREKFLGAAD